MAVNQNHSEDRHGAVIPRGESLLMQYSEVELSFPKAPQGSNLFSGTKMGTLFVTSYRVIFVTSRSASDPMLSFMMPFNLISNCSVEQPAFGANYIKGTIDAAPDGGWQGQATFKLVFKSGGAIEFAQLMTKAASMAAQGVPLGVLNYWISPPGIYVMTGHERMSTPQTPYQVITYGVPPARYGAPPPGYGAPPPGYGAPPPGYAPPLGYGVPPPGYRAPPGGYGSPPPGYEALPPGPGAPPPGYGAPPGGYASPPPGYEAPPAGYGAPPSSYQATPGASFSPPPGYEGSPVGFGTPPSGYRSEPPGSRDPPAAYQVPPAGSGVGPPSFVAAQTPGFEGALPSTSSQPPPPPPTM